MPNSRLARHLPQVTALALLGCLLAIGLSTTLIGSPPNDGITVTVAHGPGPEEVSLSWAGGAPMFHVYRSAAPDGVTDPGNELGATPNRSWTDLPPVGSIHYYRVTGVICYPTGAEVCDGVDNDCDGTIDGPGSEVSCDLPNAQPICLGGTCQIDLCDPWYGDCDLAAANGCEIDLIADISHCGSCGTACVNGHGTTSCEVGICTPVCDPGWDNCDGEATNGCETDLATLTDCGACGASCNLPHATESCATGACEISGCDPGWDDCDASHPNGCESSLTTLTDCGACGAPCALAHATESCATGACEITGCDPDWDDCDASHPNGCETSLTTLTDCGACGTPCALPHASESCATGSCQLTACDAGWGSCDGDGTNGCETSLTTVTDCGGCGIPCGFPNATASCSSGTCAFTGCQAGWGNCDGNVANGCETSLNTTSNCGSCGHTCSDAPQGTAICSSGSCDLDCDSFWHNCNGYLGDGCEVTTSHWPANDCSTAPYLGSKCGDANCGIICLPSEWRTNNVVSGRRGSYWYSGRAVECSQCPGVTYMRAILTPQPGSDFDLHVYTDCDHNVARSENDGSAVEVVTYSEGETLLNDSFDYRVKVVYRGGPVCATWTLELQGRSCN